MNTERTLNSEAISRKLEGISFWAENILMAFKSHLTVESYSKTHAVSHISDIFLFFLAWAATGL